MDLKDKTVLILGGSGLVGRAVARQILAFVPRKLVIVALYEQEVRDAAEELGRLAQGTEIVSDWGDIFVPDTVSRMQRGDYLKDPKLRALVLHDLIGELSEDLLRRSFLFGLFQKYRPDAVVDCINTATAFAYRDEHQSARALLQAADDGVLDRERIEEHILTLSMPQLIRHVQIILEAMKRFETTAYAKIGTSGTGGMGLNIPYTHSEEKPSRTLLTKSAVAGAHSLLLFLLGRTPGAPATFEIKPTATIGWREIGFGPIVRKGRAIRRYDCVAPLSVDSAFTPDASGWVDAGEDLASVYIDVGENGLFARHEFETVTALGSMELITPEEVADYVVMELRGRPTGKDVVAALDAATAGPTYRAGVLRAAAMERLKAVENRHGGPSVAFEMLGPPRLTKHLYEAEIISRVRATLKDLADSDAAELSRQCADLICHDSILRSMILSVGLPIIVPDEKIYRGKEVILEPRDGDYESVVPRGWVDLREGNAGTWILRAQRVLEQAAERAARDGSGSDVDWFGLEPGDEIVPSRFATWIFKYEDDGERFKR